MSCMAGKSYNLTSLDSQAASPRVMTREFKNAHRYLVPAVPVLTGFGLGAHHVKLPLHNQDLLPHCDRC